MIRFYATEIVIALEVLHTMRVAYRDLKPENIMLDADGHVKILDFGLSKQLISDQNDLQSICGTPEYIAPETLTGQGYTQIVDWWSLGVLCYEMFLGTTPFESQSQKQTIKKIMAT